MTNLVLLPYGLLGKIYRSPMPNADFDINKTTMSEFVQSNINTVVMLNSKAEAQIYAGNILIPAYENLDMNTIYFPIKDFDTPESQVGFIDILNSIIEIGEKGGNVAVHCFAGLGRTGTVLAILARKILGMNGPSAIDWVRNFVPNAIQTSTQVNYVIKFPIEKLA
jgi:protein-tyrosine phosphatase